MLILNLTLYQLMKKYASRKKTEKMPAGNRRLAKKRVQWLNELDSYRDCG